MLAESSRETSSLRPSDWMSLVSLHHAALKVELHLAAEVDDLRCSIQTTPTLLFLQSKIFKFLWSEHFRAPFTIHYPGRTCACNVYPSTPGTRALQQAASRLDLTSQQFLRSQLSPHHIMDPCPGWDISSIVHNILPTTATTPTTTLRPERNVFTLHSEVYYGGDRHNSFIWTFYDIKSNPSVPNLQNIFRPHLI